MNSRYLLSLTAALFLLASCQKDPGPSEDGIITIEASVGPSTKVTYGTDGKSTSFAPGDKIAVYGWTGSAGAVPATRVVDGVLNTLGDGGKWTPESPMLWKPGGEAHYFLGVYPARAITDFTADAYTLDPAEYAENDLLVATSLKGVAASQGAVALAFDHLMARLDVNLKFGSEFGGTPAVSSVTVGAKSTATVNYLTKAVTATGDAAAVDIPAAASAPTGYALSFSGLQVPQEGVRTVTVTIGTQEYVYEAAADIPLVSGQYTTLGLIVGKDKLELSGVTLSDWETEAVLPDGVARLVPPPFPVNYLTFTSEGTTTISLENNKGNAPKLYYSTDASDWTEWDYSELTFSSGAPLYLCGDNPDGFSSSASKYSSFVAEGDKFDISGDIMSLIDKDAECKVIPNEYCFQELFAKCSLLTRAPELPATTLSDYCYYRMFLGCTGLTTAPELPAKTLADNCYQQMFWDCTSLTAAPKLEATTLAEYCYSFMFDGCTSLTAAPELPATTLAEYCYSYMFDDCISLTEAPVLSATTLADGCYRYMFFGCTGLTEAPALPATTLADRCYGAMFQGCKSLEKAPDLPAAVLKVDCYSLMFAGCSKLAYVKCLAINIEALDCTANWLASPVAASGTFVKDENMNDWLMDSPSGIPAGWTVQDAH